MGEQRLSVVDIFKIGVGPSSSHTLGPWRAAQQCLARWTSSPGVAGLERIEVHLYGSLAKTGRGHGTDVAVIAGLIGADPETCDIDAVRTEVAAVLEQQHVRLADGADVEVAILFHPQESLPSHPNGLTFRGRWADAHEHVGTYYSVGGGFVMCDGDDDDEGRPAPVVLPFPIDTAANLLHWCDRSGSSVSGVVRANEAAWRAPSQTEAYLANLWEAMRASMFRGCHTPGVLPGGLHVRRRAADFNRRLLGESSPQDVDAWFAAIGAGGRDFAWTVDWVTAFALAVNEENACFGRVVTAPTNGAAGVVPAVLAYALVFGTGSEHGTPAEQVARFLLSASEIGCLFKKGATISAAMGGCQAEIGVSSAMAAAGLTEVHGGSPRQVLMAAEIAMEHHLGLTCDPVGGLVQIPCIERNTMGAIKAITASQLALGSDPANARVSLDTVIQTMWETALDMSAKYKETADGGLAVHIPLSLSEC